MANFADIYLRRARDRSMRSGTEFTGCRFAVSIFFNKRRNFPNILISEVTSPPSGSLSSSKTASCAVRSVCQGAFSLGYAEDLRRGFYNFAAYRPGVRSTRCRRTEANDEGNTWRNRRTLTNLA